MTLAELHAQVGISVGRGSVFDLEIEEFVRQAALLLERNHSFAYMEKFGTFTVDYAGDDPRSITLPSRTKSVRFVRMVSSAGAYTYLERINASDMSALASETPTAYFLDGETNIVLNATPEEDINCEIQWFAYTSWPSDTSESPWLVTYAPDLLIAQALILMSAMLRDPAMRRLYTQQRDEALRTVLIADDDMRYPPDRRYNLEFSATRYP